ncbi:hypothetical protein ACPOL_5201 [Acidisarcina polymorpha]|uniref:Uncharacterized protein n=1 Tax=Acidisarcina polymorpha TaxID=2211140 RepID=A0A2Z5G710_9BACT|nr:hypothetical protein ACPOL_5201 [Acidisarcina polymorpha]
MDNFARELSSQPITSLPGAVLTQESLASQDARGPRRLNLINDAWQRLRGEAMTTILNHETQVAAMWLQPPEEFRPTESEVTAELIPQTLPSSDPEPAAA